MERYKVNDGEGFNLNDNRIDFLDGYRYITFIYDDKCGLVTADEHGKTHWRLRGLATQELMLRNALWRLHRPGPDRNQAAA